MHPATESTKPTLLVVDDEERILCSLKSHAVRGELPRAGRPPSGVEALEFLRREKVHALISDQRMPVMTGVDLLRQAREIAPNTMRLLLTGYSDIAGASSARSTTARCSAFSKPWNADESAASSARPPDRRMSLRAVGRLVAVAAGWPSPAPRNTCSCSTTARRLASELKVLNEVSWPRAFGARTARARCRRRSRSWSSLPFPSVLVSETQVGRTTPRRSSRC